MFFEKTNLEITLIFKTESSKNLSLKVLNIRFKLKFNILISFFKIYNFINEVSILKMSSFQI